MVAGMALIDLQVRRDGQKVFIEAVLSQDSQPNLPAWERGFQVIDNHLKDPAVTTFIIHGRTAAAATLAFAAQDVPGHGYRTYWVRGKPGSKKALNPFARAVLPLAASLAQKPTLQKLLSPFMGDKSSKPPFRIENEFYIVEVDANGTLTVNDRRSGAIYRGLNRFDDASDCGDEYNYAPVPNDQPITARLKSVRVENGAVTRSLLLSLELKAPRSLSADRKSRSRETVTLPITSRITLTLGVPRLDIHTEVDNIARDHRLRTHFPAPFHTDTADYDGHFEIVRRSVELPPFDNTWIEQPRPEVPQRAFTDISDGTIGLMIVNRGLPEVEVLNTPVGNAEIALTLLRCCGWLSRDDFSTRNGHAGPGMPTPGAQMIGKWAFDYAILPYGAENSQARRYAYAFEAPLRGVTTSTHTGKLPASGSFLQVTPDDFILSTVKTAEDGHGWVVRGYNLSSQEVTVTITPWKAFPRVERLNLAEETQSTLQPASDGSISLPVGGYQVVTLRFAEK
jgi:alpha-mannosidase